MSLEEQIKLLQKDFPDMKPETKPTEKFPLPMSFRLGLKNTFQWYVNNLKFFNSVSKKLYDKRLGLKK